MKALRPWLVVVQTVTTLRLLWRVFTEPHWYVWFTAYAAAVILLWHLCNPPRGAS